MKALTFVGAFCIGYVFGYDIMANSAVQNLCQLYPKVHGAHIFHSAISGFSHFCFANYFATLRLVVEFDCLMRYILAFLLIISQLGVVAQEQDFKVQSVFIIRFAKYIEWPPSAKGSEFAIGVLGSEDAENAIKATVQGKTIGAKKIVVKRYNSVSEIADCDILYLPRPKSSNFYSVAARLQKAPTLLITEKEGLAQKGSCINLVYNDGKMNFEINKESADKIGLKIPANLLSLAQKY